MKDRAFQLTNISSLKELKSNPDNGRLHRILSYVGIRGDNAAILGDNDFGETWDP
jgi:hypothetical protein